MAVNQPRRRVKSPVGSRNQRISDRASAASNNRQTLWLFALLVTVITCTKDKAMPVSETIRHIWTVQTARENNTLVYTKGATANIRNYAPFRLDLTNPPTAILTDVDGTVFSGQYELRGTAKLTLTNLQPQPTGTSGTLEFTINSASSNALDITRTTSSAKTGGSVNQYQLTSN